MILNENYNFIRCSLIDELYWMQYSNILLYYYLAMRHYCVQRQWSLCISQKVTENGYFEPFSLFSSNFIFCVFGWQSKYIISKYKYIAHYAEADSGGGGRRGRS